MGLFFAYVLKSAVCLALFYLFFRLLMVRETFHRFNRFALLGLLLGAWLLPWVEVSVEQQTGVQQALLSLEQLLALASEPADAGVGEAEPGAAAAWMAGVLLLYLAGVLFFVCRHVCSLVQLLRLLRRCKREALADYLPGRTERATLLVHEDDRAPFSWMGYIVVSRKDLEGEGHEILIHELAHVRNRHSWDLLVADLCIFFQWFNPASWLLKQELQNIHEFEADEAVIAEGVDARKYQLLLIRKAVGTRLYSMANSFNHSKLKKRITMMKREKSSQWARWKYLYVLPLAAVAAAAFARPEVSGTMEEISAAKVSDLAAMMETKVTENVADTAKPAEVLRIWVEDGKSAKGTPASEVEELPEFPGGGTKALMEFVRKNLRYPAAAKAKGIQGRVAVKFLVDKDGMVRDPKVLRGVNPELDAEAIRLVSSMPRWKPGTKGGKPIDTFYTVPVSFKLDNAEGDTPQKTAGETSSAGQNSLVPESLYVVDGREVTPQELKDLKADRIKSVVVWKGEEALKRYGDKGKHGVMEIVTKQGQEASGEVKVDGLVKDKDGEPIVGAIVEIAGDPAKRGTVTDVDGRFTLSVPQEGVLRVSYIDMKSVRVKAAPKLVVVLENE